MSACSVSRNDKIKFKCLSCKPSCCSERTIALTHGDLKRLRLAIGDDANIFDYIMFRGDLPEARQVRGNDLTGALTLKEHPDGSCVFLKDGRCSIHKYRPLPCKLYPFNPVYTQSNGKFELELKINNCPGVGKGGNVRLSSTRKLCERWKKERLVYDRMVADWNRRPDGGRDFVSFVDMLMGDG